MNKNRFCVTTLLIHNMGLKWPISISCYFSQYLKEMFLYHLFFQIVFKYVVFDFHKSLCLFALSLPYKKNTVFVFLHGFYTRGSNITHIEICYLYASMNIFTAENYSPATHFTTQHGCFCIIDAFSLILWFITTENIWYIVKDNWI